MSLAPDVQVPANFPLLRAGVLREIFVVSIHNQSAAWNPINIFYNKNHSILQTDALRWPIRLNIWSKIIKCLKDIGNLTGKRVPTYITLFFWYKQQEQWEMHTGSYICVQAKLCITSWQSDDVIEISIIILRILRTSGDNKLDVNCLLIQYLEGNSIKRRAITLPQTYEQLKP